MAIEQDVGRLQLKMSGTLGINSFQSPECFHDDPHRIIGRKMADFRQIVSTIGIVLVFRDEGNLLPQVFQTHGTLQRIVFQSIEHVGMLEPHLFDRLVMILIDMVKACTKLPLAFHLLNHHFGHHRVHIQDP